VRCNVLFNNGSGASETFIDGTLTHSPVVIQGRLKIVGHRKEFGLHRPASQP
jgi:hypothetical protein